ncbi:MAG: DUF1579 domain-containing protein [Chlorobi bacterium]|nr:DUF1579 domain-containing protein [Chlorobiota bacterium]MCI0715768.1 DUF1579 domain-containing protein [Chlorobiota bacterium]
MKLTIKVLLHILASIAIFLSYKIAYSQTESTCNLPEASQFDFWLGEWNLEWYDKDGKIQTGTNIIAKVLSGCVIEENFSNSDNTFIGRSFSVYNANKKVWLQTWVDNASGYLDFSGAFENGKMILSRKGLNRAGKEVMQRMVFYDISQNELYWNWESSEDDGKTWHLLWKIHYKRKI